ncbi:hypothetical protein D9M68_1000430 [compost metagenome]
MEVLLQALKNRQQRCAVPGIATFGALRKLEFAEFELGVFQQELDELLGRRGLGQAPEIALFREDIVDVLGLQHARGQRVEVTDDIRLGDLDSGAVHGPERAFIAAITSMH